MFAKLMMGAVAVLATALFAYLGDRTIQAYGEARYQRGLADGQLKRVPDILAANARAAQVSLDARDRVIAADGVRDAALSRLLPQILSAQDKVTSYAATIAGRSACLGPDRVRGIEADRRTLFPAPTPDAAGDSAARPVPTNDSADATGS